MSTFKFLFLALFTSFSTFSQTIYVNGSLPTNGDGTSWATAFNNLHDAIASYNYTPTNEIWVAKGIYNPTRDYIGNINPADYRNKVFTIYGLKLYGGFLGNELNISERIIADNPTILSGDIGIIDDETDNCYNVVVIDYKSIIDGFNIIKGGTGLYLTSDQNIIRNCNISNNKRGVYNGVNVSHNSIVNCTIIGNSPNSGLFNQDGSNRLEILNCLFENNYSETDGGAIYDNTLGVSSLQENSLLIKNTVFKNNSAFSSGGAIHHYLYKNRLNPVISNPLIVNCIFLNNSAKSGAALSQFITGPIPGEINETIINCTFTGNTYEGNGAVINYFSHFMEEQTLFGVNNIKNSIFTENQAIVSNPGTIFFQNNLMSPANIQYAINGLGLNYSNCLFAPPLFTNESNPIGLDNKWGTADDGLKLKPCSPAINAGDNSLVPIDITTDIAGQARIQLGTVDIGAYESNSNTLPTIAMENTSVTANQTGTTLYYSDCDKLIAKIESPLASPGVTPIAGKTTAKVWLEHVNINFGNGVYRTVVLRHYEITPENNSQTASGRITLYFKQFDFDDFNARPPLAGNRLPGSPNDDFGKYLLTIIKYPGISSNNSGYPNTYNSNFIQFKPNFQDIIWNEELNQWEISFNVTGFSGFFVNYEEDLPLSLISFSANLENQTAHLLWKTANEVNTKSFEIERSEEGTKFTKIGTVASKNTSETQEYNFLDNQIENLNSNVLYYRLKMNDLDGKFTYSKIVAVALENNTNITISPNPTSGKAILNLGNKIELLNTMATITNSSGIMVKQFKINKLSEEIDLSLLPKAVYLVKFVDGSVLKLIKE